MEYFNSPYVNDINPARTLPAANQWNVVISTVTERWTGVQCNLGTIISVGLGHITLNSLNWKWKFCALSIRAPAIIRSLYGQRLFYQFYHSIREFCFGFAFVRNKWRQLKAIMPLGSLTWRITGTLQLFSFIVIAPMFSTELITFSY